MDSSLNMNDLQAILAIIDAASQKGVFRAQELTAVGFLYEKVARCLNDNSPQQPSKDKT